MINKKFLTTQTGKNKNNFKLSSGSDDLNNDFWQDVLIKEDKMFMENEILMNYANKHIKQDMFVNENFKTILNAVPDVKKYVSILDELHISYDMVLAGGAVRDVVLGKSFKDADMFIRIAPKYNGLLSIKKEILEKYGSLYPKNPFIIFLQNIKSEYQKKEKREDPKNIFELSINEYLDGCSIENSNKIYSAIKPYISNLNNEDIIIKNDALVLSVKEEDDSLIKFETTVTVLSLMMTLISDMTNGVGQMFLQLTSVKKEFLKNISYLRFSSKKMGAVIKLDNNLPLDIVFETGSDYPMEDFDWSLNKVGVLIESVSYYEIPSYIKIEQLEPSKTWEILQQNNENYENNKSKDYKMEYSYLEEKVVSEFDFIKYSNKNYLRVCLPPVEKCEDVIERVLFNLSFIEALEKKEMSYTISFNSLKKLEHEMIVRKNKILMKYPDFNFKYIWSSVITKAIKDKKNIEHDFMESLETLTNWVEALKMKDELIIEKVNGLWREKEPLQKRSTFKVKKY